MQTTSLTSTRSLPLSALHVGIGALVILLTTQIAIELPFTPVPLTGQTFGVILVALVLGARKGAAAAAAYVLAGALGAPVFAHFSSITSLFGPTSGYIVGFIPAAFVTGFLAERRLMSTSRSMSFVKNIVAGLAGHAVILTCGAAVLTSFVGTANTFALGVAPFLLVDVVKSAIAALILLAQRRTSPTV